MSGQARLIYDYLLSDQTKPKIMLCDMPGIEIPSASGVRRRHGRADLQDAIELLGRSPSHAALGRHSKLRHHLLRSLDPAPRPFLVGMVHEAEEELGVLLKLQCLQRREIRRIRSVLGHRHVDPADRVLDLRQDEIRDLNQKTRVLRLDEMAMLNVAVAEVIAQLDVLVDRTRETHDAFEDALFHRREPRREEEEGHLLQHGKLHRHVPLDGQVLGGDGVLNPPQRAQQRFLVRGLDGRLLAWVDEGRDEVDGRRQGDLEAGSVRDHALVAQLAEGGVRGEGAVVVAGREQLHVAGRDGTVAAVGSVERSEHRWTLGEDGALEGREVLPRAGLAVGEPVQAAGEGLAGFAEHLFG